MTEISVAIMALVLVLVIVVLVRRRGKPKYDDTGALGVQVSRDWTPTPGQHPHDPEGSGPTLSGSVPSSAPEGYSGEVWLDSDPVTIPTNHLSPAQADELLDRLNSNDLSGAAELLAATGEGSKEDWFNALHDPDVEAVRGINGWRVSRSERLLRLEFEKDGIAHRFDSDQLGRGEKSQLLAMVHRDDHAGVAEFVAGRLGVEPRMVQVMLQPR